MGELAEKGSIPVLDIAAGAEKKFPISFTVPKGKKVHDEYYLHLSFVLGEDEIWAEKGHELAWEQLEIWGSSRVDISPSNKAISLREWDDHYQIFNEDFSIDIDRSSGQLTSWQQGNYFPKNQRSVSQLMARPY